MNGSLVNHTEYTVNWLKLVNGSQVMVNDSLVNNTEDMLNCRLAYGITLGTLVSLNNSLVYGTDVVVNCRKQHR